MPEPRWSLSSLYRPSRPPGTSPVSAVVHTAARSTCANVEGPAPARGPGRRATCSDQADLVGLRALVALGDVELDARVLLEGLEARHVDRAVVDEHVRATIDGDEAV